jgi:hypothetical protein
MGGKGQASGSDYESDVFAYVAAHVLAAEPLSWFEDPRDVPVEIRVQTQTAGDDLVVALRDGREIEVQAKHGAGGNDDFVDAAVRLFEVLHRDQSIRAVLLVSSSSTLTVRTEFREDARRLGDGIDVARRNVMEKVRSAFDARHAFFDPLVLRRFRLIVLDADEGSAGAGYGQSLLARIGDPDARYRMWAQLAKQGLRVARRAGSQDRDALGELLGLPRRTGETRTDELIESYIDWAIETNATFLLAPLPDVRLDSYDAWDELAPRAREDVDSRGDADAIRTYHDWENRRDAVRISDTYGARKLLEERESTIVFGGAGSGKSTLARRLVREACDGGMVAMRVSLKQIALALAAGRSFDDALADAAFQGSGIDAIDDRRTLLSRADFLVADGLDEADPDRGSVAERLADWMKGHPDIAVIVTTRPIGHAAGLLPGLRAFELMPLHAGGISRLAGGIFAAALRDRQAAEDARDTFENDLGINRAASLAARNPMLLSCMVALALEGRPLPKGRPALYAEVIDLLHRTPPHGRAAAIDRIDAATAERVVEVAGWSLAESPARTRDDLIAEIARVLERDGAGSRFACHAAAEKAVTFWEEHRLFERLRSGAREYVTFVHLNLGEYAAARSIAAMNDDELAAWVTRVRRLAQWRQVILLSAESGAAERIASILLDFGDPADAESREAFLAAECLGGIDGPAAAVADRVIAAMVARLGGVNAPEAGETIVAVARFSPESVSRVCLPLLDDPSPVTRLVAQAGVLAGEPSLIPDGIARRFLDEYLPIRHVFLGNTRPRQISPLPSEAESLLRQTAALAMDALFRTSPRDEALQVAQTFVERRATFSLLDWMWAPLSRHDAAHLLEPYYKQRFKTFLPNFDGPDYRQELIAILDAVAESVGSPAPKDDSSRQALPLLSRVFAALRFWDIEFHGVGKGDDRDAVAYVVDRVLRGMRIDREALRRELASGYRIANALGPRGIFPHVREVAVQVNWRAAASGPGDVDRLRRALVDPARAIVFAAGELLAADAAGTAAADVIREVLAAGHQYACFTVVQVAYELLGVDAAAELIRQRLAEGDARERPRRGIFEALAVAPAALRNALLDETLAAAAGPGAMVANAAVAVLELIEHPCTPAYIAAVQAAYDHWVNRSMTCEHCNAEVSERFCSKCHVGLHHPREALAKELIRCRQMTDDDVPRRAEPETLKIAINANPLK